DAELHWEQLRSLADALNQIAAAAKQKPEGTWIVVGGGWAATQFAERRFPSRAELDAIAPKHPIYIQYLRQGALLNSAALAAAAITEKTADPPGGRIDRDTDGRLTGWLQGVRAWESVYAKIPKLPFDQAAQSLHNCFRELNRLGITSIDDIQTTGVTFAHRRLLSDMAGGRRLTVRINYYIAPNDPGDELEQLRSATAEVKPLANNDFFRFAGFGETLIRGTGDGDLLSNVDGFTIDANAKEKFRRLLRYVAETGQNVQLHATQDNTARQLLDIIEEVNRETPFTRSRIAFAHLEDATAQTLERIKALGGGITVQDRIALTGERNLELWREQRARNAPPLRTMMQAGLPLGAGSDGFRASNYSPMQSLWWLITGKTVGGTPLRDPKQNL
ncbi:MAG TPA: amidohydrolase family protein, partial [Burkholderiales bacterium]|nr:amidohydrolase family protein [Burkholderiales bacterium]